MPDPQTVVPVPDWENEVYAGTFLTFDEVMTRIDRYSTELILDVRVPPRGSVEAYSMMEVLRDALVRRAETSGDTVMSDLSPQLIGLEDHTVRVQYLDGDNGTFTVKISTTQPPFHVELRPNGDQIPAHREYEKVEVVK